MPSPENVWKFPGLISFKAVLNLPEQKIRDILAERATDGAIDLPKDYGMFICR